MSRSRLYLASRPWLVLFGAALVLAAIGGWLLLSRTANAAPAATGGQPIAGPLATLSVVDLRHLPFAPNVPHLPPLFHRVGSLQSTKAAAG